MEFLQLFLVTNPIVGASFLSGIWNGIKSGFIFALEGIYSLTEAIGIPSYVLAIFVFTLILKLILQPLMNKQMRSTRTMQRLVPQVNEIKRKYASDQMKQNQLVMALYKENNASPTSGCLPMFIQMPILIALFQALRDFVPSNPEAYSFLWINNLNNSDAIILPILAAGATFLQQYISTVNREDKTQRMMLYIFPIMFFFMVRGFPAFLAFYWIFYSLIGAAIMLPLKKKWAAEDKKIAEEEAERREHEAAEKQAKKAAVIAEKKKKTPAKYAKAEKPEVKNDNNIMDINDFDDIDEEDIDFEAVPEEGEDIYHWIIRRGIKIRRKKMKLHPYSVEEELVETCIMPDKKELDISALEKEYRAFTNPPPSAPDMKSMFGFGKKKQNIAESADEDSEIIIDADVTDEMDVTDEIDVTDETDDQEKQD